jgi:hypothetical protein
MVPRMGWNWRYADASGATLEADELPRTSFPTQADAESWIGESWEELVAGGVTSVVLLEDGAEVYGPMSLLPPD